MAQNDQNIATDTTISQEVTTRGFSRVSSTLEALIAGELSPSSPALKNSKELFYSLEVSKEIKAVRVEPVNGNPYIYFKGGNIQQYVPVDPRSGSGSLRARMLCQIDFNTLVNQITKRLPRDMSASAPTL